MIAFPNGKINLGLRVLGKRSDGYHDLETVFYPIAIHDALEAVPSTQFQLTIHGDPVPGPDSENLCARAYGLLKKDFPDLPPVSLHLLKHIPTGAGLGGGSSDGAATLRLLHTLFKLPLSAEAISAYALKLGSDCPFFLLNRPCLARGRGEILEPLPLDLSGYSMVLVHPGIQVATSWAFSKIVPNPGSARLATILQKPVENWKNEMVNDFEEPVFSAHPPLRGIRDRLYAEGALYAQMTGSGSSFFGIFAKEQLPARTFLEDYPIRLRVDLLS